MQSQLEIRDSQIHELKRLYKDARDTEARNADALRQLRAELARQEGCTHCSTDTTNAGMIDTDADIRGMIQQENRELRERVSRLESQLRFALLS